MQEPYSIKILNDLATVAIAMQGFAEAVRPLPCLVLLNIHSDAASVMNCINEAGSDPYAAQA